MAESNPSQQRPARPTCIAPAFTFLQIILSHAPNTTPLLAFLFIFFVSALTLLILTALALSATVLGFIFFMPLVLFTSPIWLPGCTLLFLTAAGFLLACGFGGAVAAGSTWMFRYFWGMHPPGSNRVGSARTRICDTASHVKDYVGYLQSKRPDKALIEWLHSCLDLIWLLVKEDKCRLLFYELLQSGLQFIESIPDNEALFIVIRETHRRGFDGYAYMPRPSLPTIGTHQILSQTNS
ncbi:hypothetical protein E1A91_A01G161800v1 [Gossypium mustelinum]|uniref:Oleosin n=1 Tax=Gossypium mustelinum TaxID=34275 RepID=A0A5D3AHF8_GOSMU|nr:hypothetical protein E1A91_A01G161800v1 [Gossypium mustelinum]